jgi:maltose O-acetyltransferase
VSPDDVGQGALLDLDRSAHAVEVRRRMTAGERYQGSDPVLVADRERAYRLTHLLNTLPTGDDASRRAILAQLLGTLGEGAALVPPLRVDYGYNVHLGDRSFVNFDAVMLDVAPITIGADCQLATRVQLLTATHPIDAAARATMWEWGEPITLEDGVWLGGGVIVLPGVTIGAGTVVGAGAVVTRDLPPGVVAVGNPARVLREVGPDDR